MTRKKVPLAPRPISDLDRVAIGELINMRRLFRKLPGDTGQVVRDLILMRIKSIFDGKGGAFCAEDKDLRRFLSALEKEARL